MKKIFILFICCLMVITGCNKNNNQTHVDNTQDKILENVTNPQNPQTYPQEENPQVVDKIKPFVNTFSNDIIQFTDFTQNQIRELTQRFLTLDIILPFKQDLTESLIEQLEHLKVEYNDTLQQGLIKKATLSTFFEKTDQNFSDTRLQYLVLANKNTSLPFDFAPTTKAVNVKSNKQIYLEEKTAEKVTQMFADAKLAGVDLILASGYRDFDYQAKLFTKKASNIGFEKANQIVALPGESEHQTGLAFDITTTSLGGALNESFENTTEFKWLFENAYKYGFILRYPKDKVDITQYTYEPWHYRYVGDEKIAKQIKDDNLTLEEYLQKYQ